MERGASLAGEDRGKGGWNHLDAAAEGELLCLSGRRWCEWSERECGWVERREKWYKRQETEKSTRAGKVMSGGKTRRVQKKQEEATKWGGNTDWETAAGEGYFLIMHTLKEITIALSNHLSSYGSSPPWSPVSAAQAAVFHGLNTVIAGTRKMKCELLWCFKHDMKADIAQVRACLTTADSQWSSVEFFWIEASFL